MRAADARAANRLGSSIRILLFLSHGWSISQSGAIVVLPEPGGAESTARPADSNAEDSAGSTSSTGSFPLNGVIFSAWI